MRRARDDDTASDDAHPPDSLPGLHASIHDLSSTLRVLRSHFPDLYFEFADDFALEEQLLQAKAKRLRTQATHFQFDLLNVLDHVLNFRFSYEHIMSLASALLPDEIETSARDKCSGSMGLAILLYRFAWPSRWFSAKSFFGRSTPWLSRVYHCTLDIMYDIADIVLRDPSLPYLTSGLYDFLAASEPFLKDWGLSVYGVVDGTFHETCKPLHPDEREAYSSHKHGHGLGTLSVNTMDGMCAHVIGPTLGRSTDALSAISGNLLLNLDRLNAGLIADGIPRPCIIGDAGFALSDSIVTPWSKRHIRGDNRSLDASQKMLNFILARERMGAEWAILVAKKYWKGMTFATQHQLLLTDPHKGVLVSYLLANFIICAKGSQHEDYYGVYAPPFDDYLKFVVNRVRFKLARHRI